MALFISCHRQEGDLYYITLDDTRDKDAAETFFRQCKLTTGVTSIKITTEKVTQLGAVIEAVFPEAFSSGRNHDISIESDHFSVKARPSYLDYVQSSKR